MVYTSNVPQANQQIATTQPIINANFGFLAASIGQEHNFNASGDGTDTYHLQASMPNQADPSGALPSGTNGLYYVNSGVPKFYDGTTASFIQLAPGPVQKYIIGTVNVNNPSAFFAIAAFPANSVGQYYIYSHLQTSAPLATTSAMGMFTVSENNANVGAVSDPNIVLALSTPRTLTFQTSATGTYQFMIVYWNL